MASTPMAVDGARKFEKVCGILERYGHRPSGLIPILQAIQHEYQYLPEEVLTYVAIRSMFLRRACSAWPRSTRISRWSRRASTSSAMCDGTACHVKHSLPVLDALHQKLGTSEKQKTTADMLFTVETVACLGACGLAPVLVIDEQVYGGITPERAVALVDEITALETAPPCAPVAPAVQTSRRKSMPEQLVTLETRADGYGALAQLRRVIICAGTGCMANGAMKVFEHFKTEMAGAGINVILELRPEAGDGDVRLSKSGCQGFCQMGPLVSVVPDGILYTKVRSEDVAEIVQQTLVGGQAVERLLYRDPATRKSCRGLEENPFYARQNRLVLKRMRISRSRRHSRIHSARRLSRGADGVYRDVARRDLQEDQRIRVARPRRRRIPYRPQVGSGAHSEFGKEIRHLQWRRRRPGRIHEPLGDGRQSAQRD